MDDQLINESMFAIIIIYHDFLSTPRRGSHVKSDKTHTQSSRYTPQPIYLTAEPWLFNVYLDGVVREVNVGCLEKGWSC